MIMANHAFLGFSFGPRQANLVLIAYASSEGSGEPAHSRSLARTSAARSYKQWVKMNLQTESQIPGLSEWLGMRSLNLSWRNARRHKFAWRGSFVVSNIMQDTVCITVYGKYSWLVNLSFKKALNSNLKCSVNMYTNDPECEKTNKMTCAPIEDSDQPGHPPSLIRILAIRRKKLWVLGNPQSAYWSLWYECTGWYESSLGAHFIL